MPLDIDDADYVRDTDDLAELLSRLDENGWDTNSQSKIRQSSGMRVRYQLSLLREEILELSLSFSTSNSSQFKKLV